MFVANSSTLILLAKTSALTVFLESIDGVIIPEEVYKESVKNKISFDALLIQKYVGTKIIVKKISIPFKKVQEQFRLDEGEASAYVLFDSKIHTALLTDDRELIKLCKIEGIKFLCAIAIIVQLYKKKLLTKEECVEKIEKLQIIGRYSKEIIDYFKTEVA